MRALARLVGGAVAGLIGTYAMDRLWYRRYREAGGEDSFMEWEISTADSFEEASAPAQVGKMVADAIGVELPDSAAGVTTNVVHWATGAGWGALAAALRVVPGMRGARAGIAAGVAAFATSYVVLPRLGVYDEIWDYDSETIWNDLSAHLVFGATVGVTLDPAVCLVRGT